MAAFWAGRRVVVVGGIGGQGESGHRHRPDFTAHCSGSDRYTLVNEGAGKPPQFVAGGLLLLDGEPNQRNAWSWTAPAPGLYRHIEVRWNMTIGTGGDTASFALLNTATAGVKGSPSTVHSLGGAQNQKHLCGAVRYSQSSHERSLQ